MEVESKTVMSREDCTDLVQERQLDKDTDEIGGLRAVDDGDDGEKVAGSNVVLVPLPAEDHRIPKDYSCDDMKAGSRASNPLEELVVQTKEQGKNKQEKKHSRRDRMELGRLFQEAVSSHDWELAESLVLLADPQTLNDVLCIALDTIWFLTTWGELNGITGLIKKIVSNGGSDFTRAILRTSFLASCVYACHCRIMNLTDTVGVMAQRLHERLQECHGDEVLKAEAGVKVQKFTDWALKCIGFHFRYQENRGGRKNNIVEVQLQLSAFKTFLELAGDRLTGKDFTEAFDAACFPLTLFSSSFDYGWALGISAIAVQGLLGMLVEGGADNVNQCFLEASRFGSTELVRILLQATTKKRFALVTTITSLPTSSSTLLGTYLALHRHSRLVALLRYRRFPPDELRRPPTHLSGLETHNPIHPPRFLLSSSLGTA
ncbi:hypothetical protein B296_00005110 [Ensete ventricosum]|uniref:Ankyrin repeat protein SKIP35 n=1 Tax=Ensete ventricosum TaxID=4639 RepID=A0A426ZX33_ENSVE|nr:hypothetical protein B296_00005110 [Ensete ventricosum]